MAERIEALGEPLEPEARLWRFMDFTKYVAMLHCRALFFSRADELPDPFEGLSMRPRGGQSEQGRGPGEQPLKRRVLLSCWHQNEHESAAMWRIYLSGNEGVAIKTSAARLQRALSGVGEPLYLGCVRYVDDRSRLPPQGSELEAFFCKRKSFDYEREARVLLRSDASEESGRYLAADLETLIEEVVVSPMAEPWFAELVASVSKRYGFDLPITRSILLEAPGSSGTEHQAKS
jgi:hypothetical protein